MYFLCSSNRKRINQLYIEKVSTIRLSSRPTLIGCYKVYYRISKDELLVLRNVLNG